ncbi:MAG: TonB-dependent receptor [Chitinophagaceae bacterium]|nr:MAG: TonB-dependent receptor [Chitinophagaceae bacterium]
MQTANDSGVLLLRDLPPGRELRFSAAGFMPVTLRVSDTLGASLLVALQPQEEENEEVIVTSFRTESRIENLPTRVEVIGSEEVDEETGIKPANVNSLLGDIAGVQAQQASAVSGNSELRVQGLPGKYTQLLRDGMPLFGAFAGNFSLLQLPPLDLKQIEIVKGATSTLYGGGAIAGMINLVTRRPQINVFEKTVLLNASTLGEQNANLYLAHRNQRLGFSFFLGGNRQQEADVDGDGYSDVARSRGFFAHPVLYFYPGARNSISVGYTVSAEERSGGDMQVLRDKGDPEHAFFIRNKLWRHTADVQWEFRRNTDSRLTVKAIGSWFDRAISANTFAADLKATQFSFYTELSAYRRYRWHDVVAGMNIQGQDFRSPTLRLPGESYATAGFFFQDDWRPHPKLTLESGIRVDICGGRSAFVLPRLALLYRIARDWTMRLGGGFGYRVPSVFESDVDERLYPLLRAGSLEAEESKGGNWDINFHRRLGSVDLTVNQSLFVTSVKHVAELRATNDGYRLETMEGRDGLVSRGTETYIQLRIDELEAYLGYTFTDVERRYVPQQPRQPLIARDKFAAVISYAFTSRFRAILEASHIGRQYLEEGRRTPSYGLSAAMLRYDWPRISVVANCENLFDYRQSRRESLIAGGTRQSPVFRELWAPIDGRVANLSVRFRW